MVAHDIHDGFIQYVVGAQMRAMSIAKHHSQTNYATVQMTQIDGTLQIEVRDQGVGFDAKQIPSDRFGLRGIRERARLFGGKAKIESAPGDGTRVFVELPVASADDETNPSSLPTANESP